MSVIITVQSVVYNLAGDEIDRIHYLRSLVMRNVLSGTKDTIADTLRNGYLNGPGIQMRSFYRWADNPDHFGSIGMPSGKMEVLGDVDTTAIAAHISSPPGTSVWVQNARAGYADLLMWAKRWIYANRPDDADGDWEVDYDAETQILTITFDPEDPADPLNENWVPTDIQQIVLTDFDPDLVYIYAFYTIVTGEQFGPYEEGDRIVLDPGEAFPSTSGWEENGLWSDTPSVSLDRHERDTTTITYSYSDGRPDDVVTTVGDWTTTTSQTTTTHLDNWYKKTTNTSSGNSITRLHEHMNQIQNHTINSVSSETTSTTTEETTWNDGTETDPVWVTMTTTTETTTEIWQDEIEVTREYQIDTQTETIRAYSDTLLMIYQIGSGNAALDTVVTQGADYKEFFPVIPVRINNTFLSESNWPTQYVQAKKAYKKAVDGNFDKLVDALKENKNIKEMDYVFIKFGVALNVLDNSCRRYIYTFLEKMMETQSGSRADYLAWKVWQEEQQELKEAWDEWYYSGNQTDEFGNAVPGPDPDLDEPPRPEFKPMQTNQLRVKGKGSLGKHYDTRIQWVYAHKETGTGLAKTGAKKGEVWIQYVGTDTFSGGSYFGSGGSFGGEQLSQEKIRVYWQHDEDSYSYMEVMGFTHRNYVYQGHVVKTTAKQALDSSDESGFIIPLHYDTWRAFSLVDASQMATASTFLVVNAYQVHIQPKKKRRWWQVFLVIIFVIVAIVFTGGGLLGANLALGQSLGFTGMSATLVGAIANTMAALVVSTIVGKLAESMGPIGKILGALLMIAIGAVASAFSAGGNMAINWSQIFSPENLLRMTDAVLGAIMESKHNKIVNEISSIQQQMQDYAKNVERESAKIQQAFLEKFGYGSALIDPMMFVDSTNHLINESRDTFLTRTLMTGSDIAELSNELLSGFTDHTLKLPDAFT